MIQSITKEGIATKTLVIFAKEFDENGDVKGSLQINVTAEYLIIFRALVKTEEDYTDLKEALEKAYLKHLELKG